MLIDDNKFLQGTMELLVKKISVLKVKLSATQSEAKTVFNEHFEHRGVLPEIRVVLLKVDLYKPNHEKFITEVKAACTSNAYPVPMFVGTTSVLIDALTTTRPYKGLDHILTTPIR